MQISIAEIVSFYHDDVISSKLEQLLLKWQKYAEEKERRGNLIQN